MMQYIAFAIYRDTKRSSLISTLWPACINIVATCRGDQILNEIHMKGLAIDPADVMHLDQG